jgi:2-keto-4-pentenoate hydratase/2-oxohepta-3-ene-1,7-dioic acid hydratase in catechol pathway
MKVLTWRRDGLVRPGLLRGDEIVDLSPWFDDTLALIDAGDDGLDRAREALEGPAAAALADVELLAPLKPRQLRDFIAFEEHLRNGMRQSMRRSYGRIGAALLERLRIARVPDVWYERPLYYKANRFSVVGHEHDVQWPPYCELLDYELELAMVVGRTGRDIAERDARKHIFGFTIFNDVSARDTQGKEMGPGFHLGPSKSKDFDTGNVLGPWIVTRDELDPYGLRMTARVDGETWSEGRSSTMYWSFEQMLAWVSRSETVHAGEVFGSGTVGTGCGLEQGRFLHDGAVVELEIEGIGVLRNRVVR